MPNPRLALVAAVHVFLRRSDQVLLLLRHDTGYMDGCYSVVAGHLDGDEEVVTAAIREAREEAGIEIPPSDVKVVGVMHRRSSDERVDLFVECPPGQGTLPLKALVVKRTGNAPPRTHNLVQLVGMARPAFADAETRFLTRLGAVGVTTRYPEELSKALKDYPPSVVREYVGKAREIVECLKKQAS